MITHLAMNAHPNPEKVLVIGGGDGGVLREVVKHECVKEAILCDIDEVRQLSLNRNTGIPVDTFIRLSSASPRNISRGCQLASSTRMFRPL
jgi:hypothetical protein